MNTTAAIQPTADRHTSQGDQMLWTVIEVAVYVRVSAYTVRKWAREGIIPHYRVGRNFRFDPTQINQWLARRRG